MDDKTMEKQEKLIEMVSGFCDERLDDEYKGLCIKLVDKLACKRDVPFERGKLENWASGIVYAIGQLNFLFDDSFEPYATPDDICSYFATKKSTASNKARDIRKLLNLKRGDEEFSTEHVKDYDVSRIGGDLSQVKTLSGAQNASALRNLGDILRSINKFERLEDVRNDDLKDLISEIFGSSGKYVDESLMDRLYEILKYSVLISPACNGTILYL